MFQHCVMCWDAMVCKKGMVLVLPGVQPDVGDRHLNQQHQTCGKGYDMITQDSVEALSLVHSIRKGVPH